MIPAALLFISALTQLSYGQVNVDYITPQSGGLNGATRITIKGSGFSDANQFNYGDGNDQLGNSVQLVSSTLSIPCDVEKDSSHSTQISCYTRPMPADTYLVRLIVDGVPVPDSLRIQYTKINIITPFSAVPGSLITIKGRIFTDVYGSNTALSSNGLNVRVLRVYAGGMACELLMPESDTLYGLQLDYQYGSTGTMICKASGTYVVYCYYCLISSIMCFSCTRSLPTLATYFVSSVNKLAMFQTFAEITGIYPSIGSIQGGAIITITGRFFDETDSPARVLVGGQDCIIIGITDSTITCQAPQPPSDLPSLFPGSRGLKFETWNSSNSINIDQAVSFNENTTGYNGASWLGDASITSTQTDFIARLSGFLVPTQTDDYVFYIKGDDNYMLFFSETGNPADKAKVAYGNYAWYYFRFTNQKSKLFRLQKGKPYYIEIYLQQYGGPAALDVGLYQRSSDYSDVQTPDAVMDVQRIQAQTTVSVEQQVITLQNWNSSTAVMEVQTITVTKFCDTPCPGLFYKLIYGCEETDLLSADATAEEVQFALNNLWSIKPDTVDVQMTSLDDQNIYNVTFNSQRGDFQLLSYNVPDEFNITVDVEEQVQGISDMSTFTLLWDCVYSRPLASNASAAEVKFAIEEMLGTLCPDVYVNYKENVAVKLFRNYELDFTPGNNLEGYLTSTETPAFCGLYSLKNPRIIYSSSDLRPDKTYYGRITLAKHSQMCFAYKGSGINHFSIDFQYESNGTVQSPYGIFFYDFTQSDSWTYECFNLLEMIKSTYPGKNYYVNTIYLLAAGDFYIDVLYIGQTATTDNIPYAVRREPALASRGITIPDVSVSSVKSTFSKYTVTLTPRNCDYNFPLFSIGFATEMDNSGDTAVYRANSWPANAKITINKTQTASPPIGGTFSVQANGKQTGDLMVNILNADLQYTLQTVLELGQVSVSSEIRSCAGYSWQVKFLTATGYQPLLQINDSLVTGRNPKVNSVKLNNGGLFRQHLMGDLLRTPNQQPQVEVFINGIPSKCSGNCGYTWSANQTPVINNITVSEDNAEVLIISGTGFSNSTANDTSSVKVGDAPCSIISLSAVEIRCLLQPSSAGTLPVQVYIASIGFAESSWGNLNFTIQTTISSVSPSSGSRAGGTIVTITGSGFSGNSLVQIGTSTCDVLYANTTTIQCQIHPGEQSEGDVVVTVLTNEITATSVDAFTYSSSSTPTVSQISSNTSSVLGGKNPDYHWIRLWNASPNSLVAIGKMTCGIHEWSPTNITCLLPANIPGTYSLLVLVENLGFASISTLDQSSITYVLKVNDIQPKFGSFCGGTKITLSGSGFSTDQSQNAVKIGTVPCNVTSASENELECIIASPGNVYTVTNNGQDLGKSNGIGYAWLPARLDILPGDTVVWQWQSQLFLTGVGYRVFSVSDPSSITYDGDTFTSGDSKTPSGIFKYQFNTPGTYFYSSGYVDDANTIFLQGVVIVSPVQDHSERIYVSVGNFEANYNQALEPPLNTALDSCLAPEPTCPQLLDVSTNDSISFGFSSCYTPYITSISPSSGTIYDSIIINGTGFSNVTCANQVLIGEYPCTVSYADQNSIICNVDPENAMLVGIAELVSLTVDNYGKALNTMAKEMDRRFALLPHIDFVSPNNGSTTGYTRLTIHGSGFSDTNGSTVVSGLNCAIVSVDYTEIICDTLPGTLQNIRVNVIVNEVPSQCKGLCSFSYDSSVSPAVTLVSPTMIYNSTTLYISGSGFGQDIENILVYVGDWLLDVTSLNDTDIECDINSIPAGNYSVRVIVLNKGLSTGNFTITSPADATLLTSSGSTEGGTLLSIQGNGFDPLNTTVLVGGATCQIVSVTASSVQCFTPRSAGPGNVAVSIKVLSVTYPSLSFSYSLSDTPTVSSVDPNTGPPGTQITINGTGFGSDATRTSVTIGKVTCTVVSISDTQIQCTAGDSSGGSVPVIVKTEKGFAKSNVQFKYELSLSNVLPSSGSFGGGLVITLTGSGFDQLNSQVFVCNSECMVDRIQSTSNSLFCVTPTQNASTSTLSCNVQVVNGKDSVQMNNSFSYDSALTPVISNVSPKRGGTGGGTRLTITGSQFGTDISLVSVSIAKTNCTVQSLNDTCIICVTGEHSPSQQATVQVMISGQGFARMGNAGFFYIDVWSSIYTWGGETPPDEGSLAVITQGQTILLDQSTPVLKMLLIQGSLIFDEVDIELQAENILITDGGVLQVGTEAAPFQHKAIITLHGHLRSPELPVYGAKTLAVRHGTLDLHGQPVPVTWTRLAQTAEAGSSALILQKSVTWKAGDEIVIASTGHRHSQKENEKMTIQSVSPDVRGSNNVEWSDKIQACPDGFDTGEFATQTCFQGRFGEEVGSDQFGGCIMFHAPQPDQQMSIGRIEYVEVFHAGQAFRLGRYPIHWHLMGDVQFKSYVRGCGIHQTYNRAVTIHNTHHLLCENTNPLGEFYNNTVPTQGWFGIGFLRYYRKWAEVAIEHTQPAVCSLTTWNCQKEQNGASIGVKSIAGLCVDRWWMECKFDGVQYYNSPNKAGFRWEHEVVLIDIDGTLTGTIGNKVVPGSGLLDPSMYKCCALSSKTLTHKPGWMALLPSTNIHNWYFHDADLSLTLLTNLLSMGKADMFTIIDQRNGSLQPLSWDNNTNGDWFFNDNTTTLTYLVSGKRRLQKRAVAGRLDPDMVNVNVNLQVISCFFKNCIPPPPLPPTGNGSSNTGNGSSNTGTQIGWRTLIYWSNRTFWETSVENNYTVPKDGSNVVIPIDKWVIADVDIPNLENLVIYGVLEMKNLTGSNSTTRSALIYKTTVLNATYISIQGGRLIAGYENDPFQGELEIILRGDHLTPEMPLPDGPNQGSKVLGVFGQLDLHGLPQSVYKTKLARTVSAGAQTITLADAVDWKVGDEILITTTSYDAWQTETRQIIAISPDMKNLTLNSMLTYTHIAKTYQVPNSSLNYTMAADIALLTRNIKIIGHDYPGLYRESFGARVLVSTFIDGAEFTGSAKIENVEFYHTGQEGYRDPTDPRYSLAFLYLGEIPENSSYVRGCAFHNGFSPAIGVFSTNGLDVDDNVIHYTVGEGIRVWGERVRLRRNLVALAIWPGSYQDRAEQNNILWHAGIEINKGSDIVLQNNVVAGFERVGYRINGEPCTGESNPSVEWLNNEAYGGLYGVYMNQDGLPGCSLIRRFKLWKCFDYGIYVQSTESLRITESVFVDNGMGIFTIVYTPAATSHQTSDKTATISNSLFVGSSPDFNCNDTLTDSDANIKISATQRSTRPMNGGRSGICWPAFVSSHNMAPGKPHAGLMSYNTISGVMTVTDSTFVGYKNVCSTESNVMFITNPLNDDLQHPIEVSGINMIDVAEDQKVFIHRPDLSKVNPSDCVDMSCDAKRKSLLKDLDGSFLGSRGSVVPQSEYQWNGDASYGLGDYRIPKVILTRLNGSRIPVSEVAPNKGIIRDSSCVYMSAWESYKCFGLNYEMLVIESLDSDTETRRLSPVAVLGSGYIDLINGPQDHGWCSGYTCQKRVSLFHSIVATNMSFDVYFTSTSPQKVRLMLLNADSAKAVRVGIYYSNPQRLDVYVQNSYLIPTNGQLKSNGEIAYNEPTYAGQYMPKLNSTVNGDNYFDPANNMLYILVRGSTPVEIRTTPLIVVSFKLPAMTADQFYGDNLVRNLAIFLKIPKEKIRITKIIAEGGRRRKRATGGLTVMMEIADPPNQSTNTSSNSTDSLSYSNFQNMSQSLAAAAVSGSLSSFLNVTVGSMSVSDPVPSPSDPAWNEMANQTVDRNQSTNTGSYLSTVTTLSVIVQPVAGIPGNVLSKQPVVKALDSNGNCVSVSSSSLSLSARLKDSMDNYVDSGLGSGYKLEFVLNNIYGRTYSFDSRNSPTTNSTDASTTGPATTGPTTTGPATTDPATTGPTTTGPAITSPTTTGPATTGPTTTSPTTTGPATTGPTTTGPATTGLATTIKTVILNPPSGSDTINIYNFVHMSVLLTVTLAGMFLNFL
ncbi:hypothetical protein GDO86_010760 [Hymenochirus boettgeri]|uniref:Fibrocystin-L n=1 Tax=Hymenochirus boettgeri TaxID=247094 RepID=A0A8T2JGV3_9PIPI|nr:hypothetical protein GDO86_010760 [Hymenochirus boettgeri]